MKKSLIALAVLAAAGAASVLSTAGDLGRTALRTVGGAVNRALFEYQVANGMIVGAITFSDVWTGVKPRRNTPISSEALQLVVPFTLPAVNVVVGDLIGLCKVPAVVNVTDYKLMGDDADTNGAPTIACSLGTLNAGLTDLATTWKAAISVFTNNGIQRMDNAVPWLESNAAERWIGLKWTAAAATYAPSKTGLLVLDLIG